MRTLPATNAIVALAMVMLIFISPVAFAQSDSTVELDGFLGWLRPYVLELLSLVIGAAVLWATKKFHDLTGINIEARHREALQSALNNGVNLAINRIPLGGSIDVKSPGVAAAVRYVLDSVPDAVEYFGLTPDRITELLKPKIIKIQDEHTAAVQPGTGAS